MKTLKITALLTYDDDLTHSDEQWEIDWFMEILKGDHLAIVDRSEIGDEFAHLKILTIEDESNERS